MDQIERSSTSMKPEMRLNILLSQISYLISRMRLADAKAAASIAFSIAVSGVTIEKAGIIGTSQPASILVVVSSSLALSVAAIVLS